MESKEGSRNVPVVAERYKLDDEGLWTVPETASEFNLSGWAIYKMIKRGNIRALRIGKMYLIPDSQINRIRDRYIEGRVWRGKNFNQISRKNLTIVERRLEQSLYTVAEYAERYDYSLAKIKRQIKDRGLPVVKVLKNGKNFLVRKSLGDPRCGGQTEYECLHF